MSSGKTGFALIGAGLFGERHAQAYSRHHAVDFAAVCDLDETRARLIAERYGARRFTTSLESILADPEIVAVSIATPDHAHRDVAVACARAGKHMLLSGLKQEKAMVRPALGCVLGWGLGLQTRR